MSDGGYITLHRKFFDHAFWKERREFSKAEAWIDLIEQARWKDSTTSTMINGEIIRWGRGQLIASIRFLQQRWNWKSTKKVHRFVQLLSENDMIRLEKETATTRITICKYDTYQHVGNTTGNTKETPGKHRGNKTGITENNREDINIAFSDFWDAYGKKVGSKRKAESKWNKLKDSEREYIMERLPGYVSSFSDKKYQPHPETFLNQRRWESEDEMKPRPKIEGAQPTW